MLYRLAFAMMLSLWLLCGIACDREVTTPENDPVQGSEPKPHGDTLSGQYPGLVKSPAVGHAELFLSLKGRLAATVSQADQTLLIPLDGTVVDFGLGPRVSAQVVANNTITQMLIEAGISIKCSARVLFKESGQSLIHLQGEIRDTHVLQREELPFSLAPGRILDITPIHGAWLLENGKARNLYKWQKGDPGQAATEEWELSATITWNDMPLRSTSEKTVMNAVSVEARVAFLETGRFRRIEVHSAVFDWVESVQEVDPGKQGASPEPGSDNGSASGLAKVVGSSMSRRSSDPIPPDFSGGHGWSLPLETIANNTKTTSYVPIMTQLTVRRRQGSPARFEFSFKDEYPRAYPDITEPSSPLPEGISGSYYVDSAVTSPLVLCTLSDEIHDRTESVVLERFVILESKVLQ